MKRISFVLLLSLCSLVGYSQALHIFHDGKTEPKVIANGSILRISIQPKFIGSTEYQQVFETLDGNFRFEKIDSVKFNLPHLVSYRQNYFLPFDARQIHIAYSSSYDGCYPYVEDESLIPFGGGWFYLSWNNRKEEPTRNFKLLNTNGLDKLEYPFSITFSDKCALDSFYVKFSGEGVRADDNLHLRYYDPWHLVSEPLRVSSNVEKIILPRWIDDLNIIGYTMNRATTDENNVIQVINDNGIAITDSSFNSYIDSEGNLVIKLSENKDDACRLYSFNVGNDEFFTDYSIFQYSANKHTAEEHMQALRDFYNKTDGPNWRYQKNWWSDKLLRDWDNLSSDNWDLAEYKHTITNTVNCLYFAEKQFTGVYGTIPESFTTFLDDCARINLSNCALHGVIPFNVRHHRNWQKFGWSIIPQDTYNGGGFDYEDINLHIDNTEITDFVNDVQTTTFDILKKNKLTWVFNAGMENLIDGISDRRVNLYLDYRNKGLGVVAQVLDFPDLTYEDYKNWVVNEQLKNNLPKEITWVNDFDKATVGALGSMSVLDSEGNLLWYGEYNQAPMSWFDYEAKVDSVCRKYLGEPEAHDPYSSKKYESVDYSKDGEVITLQKASVGRGIDLVFLGDQYVDTMMESGGLYEKDMEASMEYFFDVEPYKSLRDRFNVYAVKVVSKNDYDGTDHRINFDDATCFEYTQKIPDIDMDNVTICVISGYPFSSFFLEGQTIMYSSGASIAYITKGGPSEIICHEAGGHGFAKLIDEYIHGGYEDFEVPEVEKEHFINWVKTDFHDRGWGINVATTDDPELVPWAHFLKDDRYKNEVGIYKGAWLYPNNLWRASESSIMNDAANMWFNAPARESIYKRVMQLSEGESWNYDYEEFVKFDHEIISKAGVTAKRTPVQEVKKKFFGHSPQVINGGWKTAQVNPSSLPVKQEIHMNIPKDKKLTPVDQFKGDFSKAHTVRIESTLYVIE